MDKRELNGKGLELIQKLAAQKLGLQLSKLASSRHTNFKVDCDNPDGVAFGYLLSEGGVDGHVVFIHGSKSCVVAITKYDYPGKIWQGSHVAVITLDDRVKLHD